MAALAAWMLLGLTETRARADEAALPDDLVQRVEALLGEGIEAGGAEARIVALGEAGERALEAVFEGNDRPAYVRLRALEALQAFQSEASARYFERLVLAWQLPDADTLGWGELHPARSPLVLRRALEGLVALAPRVKPQLEPASAAACLAHDDAHVRRAAADLLALLEEPEGPGMISQALHTRLARERSRMVRGHLERALTSRLARPAALR